MRALCRIAEVPHTKQGQHQECCTGRPGCRYTWGRRHDVQRTGAHCTTLVVSQRCSQHIYRLSPCSRVCDCLANSLRRPGPGRALARCPVPGQPALPPGCHPPGESRGMQPSAQAHCTWSVPRSSPAPLLPVQLGTRDGRPECVAYKRAIGAGLLNFVKILDPDEETQHTVGAWRA